MTETLKDLMDRASEADFDRIDLSAIIDDGDRTIRRRRGALISGVAALAVVAGGLVATLGGGDRARDHTPVADTAAAQVAWVTGATLHTPETTVDLGRQPAAFVQTRAGSAFTDRSGTVYSVVDGTVARIGEGAVGEGSLVGDESGTMVGWVDGSGDVPAYVTLDLATGDTWRHSDHLDASMATGEPPQRAWFFGVDGHTAYWIDLRGTIATDLATGTSTVLDPMAQTRWIGDVTDGMRVRLVEDRGGADLGSDIVDVDGRIVVEVEEGRYFGAISPDGRWVTTDVGTAAVLEIATGTVRPLGDADPEPGEEQFAYGWLDADTALVAREGVDDASHVTLLTCEVGSGECTVVVEDLPEGTMLPGNSLGR